MKTAAIDLLRRRESRRQYLRVILLILAALVTWGNAQAGDNACLQGVRVAREAYAIAKELTELGQQVANAAAYGREELDQILNPKKEI